MFYDEEGFVDSLGGIVITRIQTGSSVPKTAQTSTWSKTEQRLKRASKGDSIEEAMVEGASEVTVILMALNTKIVISSFFPSES